MAGSRKRTLANSYYLDTAEFAKLTGLNVVTVRRQCATGKLDCICVDRKYMIVNPTLDKDKIAKLKV